MCGRAEFHSILIFHSSFWNILVWIVKYDSGLWHVKNGILEVFKWCILSSSWAKRCFLLIIILLCQYQFNSGNINIAKEFHILVEYRITHLLARTFRCLEIPVLRLEYAPGYLWCMQLASTCDNIRCLNSNVHDERSWSLQEYWFTVCVQ